MSLEEEITINQFGQGVYLDVELLDQFSQLDEDQKRKRVVDLIFLLGQSNPMKKGVSVHLHDGELEESYKLLLDEFKKNYQRNVESGKRNADKWQYSDLSSPEVVQSILTKHQELVEEIYTNPSFRSEFASLAKLRNDRTVSMLARSQEPDPEQQTHFDFVTYNEMIAESIKIFDDKTMRAMGLLQQSVEKALSVRYGLATDQIRRAVLDVVERHLRETYNTGLL